MGKLLMGMDIGTSACKAALFDPEGNVMCRSTEEYPVYYPAPGYVEQNPLEWWEAVCRAVRRMIDASRVDVRQIAGIGVAGQSWSAIPVDRQGHVLCNTPIWMDTRSGEICREVLEKLGHDRIFQVCGNPFEPTYTTPKILWFREQRPEIFRNTFQFLQSNSYIVYRLTGVFTQDLSQGYGLHFFHMQNGQWDEKLSGELGIPLEKLPELFPCDKVVGEVTRAAGEAMGLPSGIPVVAGGLDAACGALGAGVIHPGQTQEQGGQAGGMSICLSQPKAHPRLILGQHVVPDRWLLQGGTVGGGGTLKWFRQEFGASEEAQARQSGKGVYQIMDEEASGIAPGSEGVLFLPYMAGERSPVWDKHAKGVYFGLDYHKTRAHMIRATMEGCAYALLHNLKTAEEAGAEALELTAMGGAANSRLWTRIKSDVTGKTIRVSASDTATALGAAILAGVGTGVYRDFQEAVKRACRITRVYDPDQNLHLQYDGYYGIYRRLYDQLKNVFREAEKVPQMCGGDRKPGAD